MRSEILLITLWCFRVLSESFQTSTLGINFEYSVLLQSTWLDLRVSSAVAQTRRYYQQYSVYQCHHLPAHHHLLQRAPEEPHRVRAQLSRGPEEGGARHTGRAGGGSEVRLSLSPPCSCAPSGGAGQWAGQGRGGRWSSSSHCGTLSVTARTPPRQALQFTHW